jgi:hypothetical protein
MFTTCRNESDLQCTDKNTIKILPHAMDFFFFKTGSWWVYEQEGTGKRDSIYVGYHNIQTSNAVSAKKNCGCGKGKCVQNANTSFFSDKSKDKSLYGFRIGSSLEEGDYTIMEGGSTYVNYSGYRITYQNNQYDKQSPTYGTYEDLESITVKGRIYTDILHHYYTQSDNIPDWQHEAWYARNIYLVKFRLWDGTTWNLVKYNIVQ